MLHRRVCFQFNIQCIQVKQISIIQLTKQLCTLFSTCFNQDHSMCLKYTNTCIVNLVTKIQKTLSQKHKQMQCSHYNSVRVPARCCSKCPSCTMSPGKKTYAVYDAIAMKASKKQSYNNELRL